jgi:aldehyde:ferredoxin oxidoreductase
MLTDPTLANVLYVNLAKKSFKIVPRPELFEQGLGGAGAAIRLLAEECPPGCDPLAPESPIVFAVGPLTGLLPLASKTVAMFKSPHTGNLGESHCGGRSAVAIRLAGYGAIVITGASDLPLYLAVHGRHVTFHDARALWGMKNSSTAARIIRQNQAGAGTRTIMRIGAAGENLVSYAAVTTETYRHFGRLGLGALFGSKKLKAILVAGNRSIPVSDSKEYSNLYDEIYQAAVSSPAMKKYHDLGTPENVLPLNELRGLPTMNLQAAHFEAAAGISGEHLAQNFLGRRLACAHCPVGCIHIAALREPYPEEPYFYKTLMIGYDHELIYALGSLLGVGDAPGLLRLLDRVEELGLDAITAGVVLAWATEAMAKGLISAKDTDGIQLAFGDWEAYLEAMTRIVTAPTEFYRTVGHGVEAAAQKYGGLDFALAFGGNEMAGYHTGPAAHLGWLVGARHSHLDNAGYSVDQKVLMERKASPAEVGEMLLKEERARQVLSSLVVCFFARGLYKDDVVVRALALSGLSFTAPDLARIGREIHSLKYAFKFREGFSFDNLRIPHRICETPAPAGPVEEAFIREAIAYIKSQVQPGQ